MKMIMSGGFVLLLAMGCLSCAIRHGLAPVAPDNNPLNPRGEVQAKSQNYRGHHGPCMQVGGLIARVTQEEYDLCEIGESFPGCIGLTVEERAEQLKDPDYRKEEDAKYYDIWQSGAYPSDPQ